MSDVNRDCVWTKFAVKFSAVNCVFSADRDKTFVISLLLRPNAAVKIKARHTGMMGSGGAPSWVQGQSPGGGSPKLSTFAYLTLNLPAFSHTDVPNMRKYQSFFSRFCSRRGCGLVVSALC